MAEQNKKLEVLKQSIFEYMVIKHPTVEMAEKGGVSEIIVPLTSCCAHDERGATMEANRAIPQEQMKDVARLEVAVRPF